MKPDSLPRPVRSVLAVAVAVLALTTGVLAQTRVGLWTYESGATTLDMTAVFDPPPPTGYLPVRVEILNGGAKARTWQVSFTAEAGSWRQEAKTRSSFAVPVEAKQSITTTLLVPLSAQENSRSWGNSRYTLQLSASTPDFPLSSNTTAGECANDVPAIALSSALALKNLTALNDELGKAHGSGGSAETFASKFDPSMLPEEWLGLSGFDFILLTKAEFTAISPGARTALFDWVRGGGTLHFYDDDSSADLRFAGLDGLRTQSLGRGRVEMKSSSAGVLDPASTVANYRSWGRRASELTEGYTGSWGLQNALGERSFAGWQVIIFLIIFGVVVAPVNLFILAPSGRRHRLFFTTPLISLAASLVLIGIILVQDGTGGRGRRVVVAEIFPDSASACVVQEQISRTGVLFGSSFDLPAGTLIEQPWLDTSPWVKHSHGSEDQAMDVSFRGTSVAGNWFQSRSVQAQRIQRFIPTRGRVEIVPAPQAGGAPTVVSSLDFTLERLVYVDPEGKTWTPPGETTVAPGQRVQLQPGTYPAALKEARKLATKSQSLAADPGPRRHAFFALARSAPTLTTETSSAIKWEDDVILVHGTLKP